MIYLILAGAASLFFAIFTRLMDKKSKSDNDNTGAFSISLLLTTIQSVVFFLILLFKRFWFDAFTAHAMRILFVLESMALCNLCFGLLKAEGGKIHKLGNLCKYLLIAFSFFIIYGKFKGIEVTFENGIIVTSPFLFSGDAKTFFPWTWFTVYTALYKYFIPVVCFVFLLLVQENKATQLAKYQSMVIGEGFIVMWLSNWVINFVSAASPAFSLLFMYSYIFLYSTIYIAVCKTSVPSGKGMFVTLLKSFVSYLIPAFGIGVVCMYLQPSGDFVKPGFIVEFSLIGMVALVLATKIASLLSSSSKLYTADYGVALEKELALIDYRNAEMDEVTERMHEILRKNAETSSMNVYILNSQNELDIAYSSNKMSATIPINNPIFDVLLNIGKSVVIAEDVEKEHELANIHDELAKFFVDTKSDALFILNEGHNIFGLITLGRKLSGDHFKEYDYNVFIKLYSYFFVFGYYMRNISNKDVISVVNREIRMSSQIITSIQENLDHTTNEKIDIGYLMTPAHDIGGEFIDMIRLTATRHLFVIGDLSGKGIAASMNMVILKSIIRVYLSEIHDFKQLVVKLNTFVRESLPKGTIFAGIFCLIDFETDTMYYINCGVPALMMYTRVYNNVIEIQGSGYVLGFVKDISSYLSVKTTKLHEGDIILGCTDGLINSHSLRGEQFGKERVQEALLDYSTFPAQRMAQFTFESLTKFMSKEMEDDVSILVLKYKGLGTETEETEETGASGEVEAAAGTAEVAAEATEVAGDAEDAGVPGESAGAAEEANAAEETGAVGETVEAGADGAEATGIDSEVAESTDATGASEVEVSFDVADADVEVTEVPVPEPEETEVSIEPDDEPKIGGVGSPAVENNLVTDGYGGEAVPGMTDDMPDLSDLDALMKEAGL